VTGRAPIDFRRWAIALVDLSQGFAGEVMTRDDAAHPAWVTLSPIYVYLGGYQVSQQGAGRQRILLPFEMLPGITHHTVRASTFLFFKDLDDADYRELSTQFDGLVEIAETARSGIRTARSGISLVPAGMKLPPMGRRG
jgi:hypothetical protein